MARLKRTSRGSIVLQNGERITPAEQRALRSAVNSANRRRKRLLEKLPTQAKSRYADFGIESDWVLRKKHVKYSNFRNKKEFTTYLKQVRYVMRVEYSEKVVATYRSNLNRAIDNVFNSKGKKIKDFIAELTDDELRTLSLSDSLHDISYVYYEPVAVENKLKQLKKDITNIRKNKALHKGYA